jgi:hypothetical protein
MKLHLATNKQKNKLELKGKSKFLALWIFFVFEGRGKKITKNAFVILSKRKGQFF